MKWYYYHVFDQSLLCRRIAKRKFKINVPDKDRFVSTSYLPKGEVVSLKRIFKEIDRIKGIELSSVLTEVSQDIFNDYLEMITLQDARVDSVKLEEVTNLISLTLGGVDKKWTIGNLPKLTTLKISGGIYGKDSTLILQCTPNLMDLEVSFSKEQSFNKNYFPSTLRSVNINYCYKLENLDALVNSKDYLTHLWIQNCKSLTDLSFLKYLKNLTKLEIYECGEVENFDWLRELENIRYVNIQGTHSKDGDVKWMNKFCDNRFTLRIQNKRHYNDKFIYD